VQTAFPGAVIIRPTVVFAPDDALLIPERSAVREVGEVEHGVLARAIGVVARVQTARRPRREAARRWRELERGEPSIHEDKTPEELAAYRKMVRAQAEKNLEKQKRSK
jgi:hypothetical protein